MGEQRHPSGRPAGYHYSNQIKSSQNQVNRKDLYTKQSGKDDDLIIEDNTVYEIDRECYERYKKQKKR